MLNENPKLTVIIPTYNRSAVLKKCLDALTMQTPSVDLYEIVVADDGSNDDTRQTVERCAAGSQVPVSCLWQSNAGANAARNQANTKAMGRLLLFINDDTIANPTMLAEHLQTHKHYPDESVAGLGRVTISPQFHTLCLKNFTWTHRMPFGWERGSSTGGPFIHAMFQSRSVSWENMVFLRNRCDIMRSWSFQKDCHIMA